MNKPKILLALFRLPYPTTDGTRYKILNNVAAGLKKDFDIEFFVVSIDTVRPEDVAHIEQCFGKVYLFHHSRSAFLANAIPALWNGLPLQSQAFHFSDAQTWLDAHIDDYDAVYVHEIRMTEFFIRYSDARKKKFLVDFNDAISMHYQAGVQKMILLKKLFYTWEGERVAKYESRVLDSFERFAIISEVDKRHLLSSPFYRKDAMAHIDIVSYGTPIPDRTGTSNQHKVYFMGNLDYEPNRDALYYFLDNIWPTLHAQHTDLEFLVLGGGHVTESYRQKPNVHFMGYVPDVFSAIESCSALVAPVRFAGGTPTKILESMGYGIPVISTPAGIAGIAGAEHDVNVVALHESDHSGWVAAIERILQDRAYHDRLAQNGRQLVIDHYSLQAAQERIREVFREIVHIVE
ncbi:glycosyltransferase [bacterium]|nr:glycosyltransferase [bacterium]